MFAERNLAQPPQVAPAIPISPVCALGGSSGVPRHASPLPDHSRRAPRGASAESGLDTTALRRRARLFHARPCPLPCLSAPSPTRCACPASTEPAPAPELITADPIPPDDDAPAPHSSPAPTPTALPSPPPSASPSPIRPCFAPPSPPPSPPSPRRPAPLRAPIRLTLARSPIFCASITALVLITAAPPAPLRNPIVK